jgi:serine/threonine-protein kinase
MSLPCADHNLIFGLLALQMDFITREQLLDAVHAWRLRKATPLSAILCERSVLDERRAALLAEMVAEHIAKHGGDAQVSLAALRVEDSVWKDLDELSDETMHPIPPTLAPSLVDTSNDATQAGLPVDSGSWRDGSIPPPGTPVSNRFRPLREHARGGLGEVFVALDEELKREVALKRIQDRFADRFDARTRFLREAEITGKLEHPGIVPVYGLGVYPDGRPYYAMRFIRGESMEHAIARFHKADEDPRRDPGERSLALRDLLTRFVAVCNSVAYAHSRGVIHRDLKPANVMLGEYGETLVVDWGLARMLDGTAEEQPSAERPTPPGSGIRQSPTEIGQAVGTPAFMSPEQAQGLLERVGVASDVFSLGATLYALLTGQAPYRGDDVLGQARNAEVMPARQRKRSVPAALEAVCGKAMAGRPEDRYPTVRGLAEEVQRWLADEPVQARREPVTERLRRWGRRNRSVVTAGVVLLAAGVVGLSIGLWAVGREQEKTKAALERAQIAEADAKESAQVAEKAVADTLADYRAGTDDAIEQLIGSRPVLGAQEKCYLEGTLKRWQAFAARSGDDERSRAIRGEGHFRVAFLRHKLGQTEEALGGYRDALAIQQKLADDFPAEPTYRKILALTHNNLGILLAEKKQHEKAAEHYHKALVLQKKLTGEFPDAHDYRQDLAATHGNLAMLLKGQNQWDKSALQYQEALALVQKLAADHPGVAKHRKFLALAHQHLGDLWARQKQQEKAVEHYGKAWEIQQKLVDEFPTAPVYRQYLAATHNSLGVLLAAQKQWEQAAEHYQKALAIVGKLAEEFSSAPTYHQQLAGIHNNLGTMLRAQDRGEKAVEHYNKALEIEQKLADENPAMPGYRSELAVTHYNLANLLGQLKQGEKASEHYHAAIGILRKLADEHPSVGDYRQDLAHAHNNLGNMLARRKQQEQAMQQYHKALVIQEKLVEEFSGVTTYQVDLGRGCWNYGNLLSRRGRPEASLEWYSKAIRALRRVDRTDPQFGMAQRFLRGSYTGRALAHTQLHKHLEAIPDWNGVIELSSAEEQRPLRIARASARVRAGLVAEGVAELAEATRTGDWPAEVWYGCACIYAIASRKSVDKKQEYADSAMELLRRAIEAGYKDVGHLTRNSELDELRGREDFKKLLSSLGKAGEKSAEDGSHKENRKEREVKE